MRIILPQTELTDSKLFLIAGPCVIESREVCLTVAEHLKRICQSLDIAVVFKSSFDKANRTSVMSFRGPGLEGGLRVLEEVKRQTGLPVLTDIHEANQASAVAEVADIVQIPAFLCRQTDLITAAAATAKPINIKKGQFASPAVMREAVRKARAGGAEHILVTERGNFFGYSDLVVDMRIFRALSDAGVLLVFDATHSVQSPAGLGNASGGRREFAEPLALAAVAAGADGLFIETHPDPDSALCDGPVMLPLQRLEGLLQKALAVYEAAR